MGIEPIKQTCHMTIYIGVEGLEPPVCRSTADRISRYAILRVGVDRVYPNTTKDRPIEHMFSTITIV